MSLIKRVFKILSRAVEVLVIALMIYCIVNFKLVAYGIQQLKGQLAIVLKAKPIEYFLADPAFPDSLKAKLHLVEDIKRFAIDSLGLKPTKNYSTLYDQKGKPLLMNLTAAERFKLKAYTWNFPLLGNVSYKGFFDFQKGRKEADALEKQNYDVEYGSVSAWSTLGFFRDPIFSGMLKRSDGQLAELIIHEMTHATVYLKSSVDFNENLASAVGETGAERFLKSRYGKNSAQLEKYIHEQNDYNLFADHMLRGTSFLDSLYIAMENRSEGEKLFIKKEMISKIVQALDTISFHGDKFKKRFADGELPNNAYFLSFVRYDSQKDDMKKELNGKFGGNIKAYLQYHKDKD